MKLKLELEKLVGEFKEERDADGDVEGKSDRQCGGE